MKKKDHFLWTRLLILIAVLVLEANSFSQEMYALTADSNKGRQSIPSRELFSQYLAQLEQRFNVVFSYESGLLDNVSVPDALRNFQADEIDPYVREIQRASKYQVDKVGLGYYVITPRQDKPLMPLLQRIVGLSNSNRTEEKIQLEMLSLREISALQQTVQVKGRVVAAETNEPLPGVTVLEKGTTNGTITNANGEYSITLARADAVLVFSYVGYKTEEIAVSGKTVINLSMVEDIKKLEEIVVIGYGTQRKTDLTGAVATVSEQSLKNTISTSIDQALQGKAAGVQVFQNSGQPGGGVSIRIRGAGSINSGSEPLYVIDGVQVSAQAQGTAVGFDWAGGGNGQTAVSALSTLNPADIVSVEILKDASASAIYGSRGANGVVIITTKRGKAGESKVNYEAYYGWQTLPKRMDVMNLREYASYQNELADLGLITRRQEFQDLSILGNGTDWQDAVFRTAPVQSHQISVSGGNERTTYALSGGYFAQDGIVIGSNFDRYSARLNLENQAKDWIKVGSNFMVSRTNERITLNDSDDGVITATLLQAPDIPLKFPDGSWGGPVTTQFGVTNPVAMALDRDLNVTRTRALGSAYSDVTFLKHFTLHSQFSTDIQFINNYAFQPTYQYGLIVNTQNQSRRNYSQSFYWSLNNYLTYQQVFAEKHDVTLMLAQEAQESNWEGIEGVRKNFVSNDVQELNAGEATTATNGGYKGSNALASYFARAMYSFAGKYMLTATFRADGSSNFGPNKRWGYFPSVSVAWRISNENFMQNLQFVSNLKLRLGYGEVGNQAIPGYAYGSALRTAPSGIGNGFLLTNLPNPDVQWESTTDKNLGIDLALFQNRIDMTLEIYKRNTDNMLLRMPLPNYMGGGSWMGIEAPFVNLGKMENKGWELSLTTHNLTGRFSWITSLSLSHNANKVLSLGEEGAAIYRNVQWFNTVTKTAVGKPLGQFYGYVVDGIFVDYDDIVNSPKQRDKIDAWAGVFPGDIKFRNIDQTSTADWIIGSDTLHNVQVIDDLDRTYIGNPYPKFSYGMGNEFRWNNFDLSIFIQGTYGNDIYNFTRRSTEGMRNLYGNQLKTVNNRVRFELIDPEGSLTDPKNVRVINPETSMPRAINTDPNENTRVSSRYVEDGSYLRIKNISFGYTFPSALISKIKANQLRIYMNIQNALTFTKYTGFDPEIGSYNQDPLLTGVDNGRYPMPRIVSVGLTLGF